MKSEMEMKNILNQNVEDELSQLIEKICQQSIKLKLNLVSKIALMKNQIIIFKGLMNSESYQELQKIAEQFVLSQYEDTKTMGLAIIAAINILQSENTGESKKTLFLKKIENKLNFLEQQLTKYENKAQLRKMQQTKNNYKLNFFENRSISKNRLKEKSLDSDNFAKPFPVVYQSVRKRKLDYYRLSQNNNHVTHEQNPQKEESNTGNSGSSPSSTDEKPRL